MNLTTRGGGAITKLVIVEVMIALLKLGKESCHEFNGTEVLAKEATLFD